MAARAGELGARAPWGYGFKVLCGYCLCLWLLAVDNWLLAIGYGYWLLTFTLKNVVIVMTHFSYCPFSMAMLITHWPL
jgi:hypothetical protein